MEVTLQYVLLNYYKEGMVSFVNSKNEHFVELVKLALDLKQKLSPRAAWLLSNCVDENDERIVPYIEQLIPALQNSKGGQQRDLLYVLRRMKLDDDQEGMLFEICVDKWSVIANIPSVRYNALLFMIEMVKKYPELINEIILLTQDFYLENLSKGIKRAARNKIEELRKMPPNVN